MNPKAVIEAALFAAGRTLSVKELAEISRLSEDLVRSLADDLLREYAHRETGIEIKRFGEAFAMQVRLGVAHEVLSLAPREIEAPLVRTLAIIAYKQPIKQSVLAEIRGNKSYAHVKELEKRGLISSTKQGRTKVLSTTRAFADYFGLDSSSPEAVRRAIMKDKQLIGVSPMYESLALRLGLDFLVVNPYKPGAADLERLREIDLLVLAPGYADRVKENYLGDIIEAKVRTLSQLKESAERICLASKSGNVKPLAAEVDSLLHRYRERARNARPIKPLTPMIEEIAADLRIGIQENGLSIAPDFAHMDADIKVPTHQPYEMDIVLRIMQRYEKILFMVT